MTDAPVPPPAAWLLDPEDASLLRWWDGTGWSGFRRPRDTDAAPGPSSAAPSAVVAPPVAPSPGAAPLVEPLVEAPAPTPPPFVPPPPAGPPPVGFTASWDAAVTATLATTPTAEVAARTGLFTAIRARVLATAAPQEEVFETFAVTVHDPDPTGGLGAGRSAADLFVTDRRALAVQDLASTGGAVLEIALADVLRVTPLRDDAVRLDLGHAPPVVLRSTRPGRHGDDLATLLATLTG